MQTLAVSMLLRYSHHQIFVFIGQFHSVICDVEIVVLDCNMTQCCTCDREVSGVNLTSSYCVPLPTFSQLGDPVGLVNEYQRKLASIYHVMQ